jgi:hypothetical protein
MTSGENKEEHKKYTVVDKRENLLDDEPAVHVSPDAGEPESTRRNEEATSPGEQEPDLSEHPSDSAEEKRKAPDLTIGAAIQFALNVIRERALLSLGLVITKTPAPQDFEQARQFADLFGKISSKFIGKLEPEQDENESRIPQAEESLNFIMNLIQGRIFVHMGLIAEPTTGLVNRDMEQARTGIDFLAALIEEAGSLLSPDTRRKLDALLADLKINYVDQLNS